MNSTSHIYFCWVLTPFDFTLSVEYPSGALPSHAVDGRRGEHYSASDDPSILISPQFRPDTPVEVAQLVLGGGVRVLRSLMTDAPLEKITGSSHPLEKTDYLFGDSVEDPDSAFLESEQWLHKDDGGFLYLPWIPRHRCLTELRQQGVARKMSWRLTEECDSIHCGFITHQSVPGSFRGRVIGLHPGILGLDSPPRDEHFIIGRTLKNRLAQLGREMPASGHRFFGWVHSADKLWWTRLTSHVLGRWGDELRSCGLYAAIRATMYGLPLSTNHFFALSELYDPDSNTFLTRHGEFGLALHEMHRVSGLPMGRMLYQEYFPSGRELGCLKTNMPDRYDTLWDLTCHYHIALAQIEPLAKRKSCISLKQFASYLFRHLEDDSGENICELAPSTPSEINELIKKSGAESYTSGSTEYGFPAGTKFSTFLWHAVKPIQPMTLLAGFLAIWLKKCVMPCQPSDALPLEVLYPAVQLAHKKELSLLPVMVANIHRGLRQLATAFTQEKSKPSDEIPHAKVELPYTYLMAWLVLHRPDMMSAPKLADPSVPFLQSLEGCKWQGRGFLGVRKQLQVHKGWVFSRCFPRFSGQYGESLIDEERPKMNRTLLDVGCFNWLTNIRPGYLIFRVRNECFIEPYFPSRFARQFGYDQLYVGNPNRELRTRGGLIDGVRAWLWSVAGCTDARFSLPGTDRKLESTYLHCTWLLAASELVPMKTLEELEAEEASRADTQAVQEAARAQKKRRRTHDSDKSDGEIHSSATDTSGEDQEEAAIHEENSGTLSFNLFFSLFPFCDILV